MSGRHFAVCIRNDDHQESLELKKIYELMEDAPAAEHDMVRVIDEEGEDYLYPRNWFLPIELPVTTKQFTFEDIHHAIFPIAPTPRKLHELKGIDRLVRTTAAPEVGRVDGLACP